MMFSWYKQLTRDERKTFSACFGGYAMDAFDTMMFAFAIPALIPLWGMSKGEAGLIGTVALLTSAVGGWCAGILADRFGRVPVLQWTVLWFSLFTFLSGFTETPTQLLVTRALEGLGFGGEWAVGSVLIAETVAARHRGKVVGMVQSSWTVGWGAAAIAYTVLFNLLPAALAWKILFWLGAAPALLIFFLRRGIKEPELFQQQRARRDAGQLKTTFLAIFSPRLLSRTLCASLLTTGAQGGYYSLTTWLPTYLKTVRGLSVLNTGGYLAVIIVGAFCGYMTGAYLCDLVGRRRTFALFAIGSAVTVVAYTQFSVNDSWMLVLGFPLGFCSSGVFSGMGSFLAELFPSTVRGSAQGFTYNFGRGIGALFPAMVGFLSDRYDLATAITLFAVLSYVLMLIAVKLLPETRGWELDRQSPPAEREQGEQAPDSNDLLPATTKS